MSASKAAHLALTAPAQYPSAALARLGDSAAALLAESLSARAGLYAGLLARLAAIADRAGPLLAAAMAQTATEAQLAGLASAERVAQAAERLFDEVARRTARRERVAAMRWARLCRQVWADVALLRREFLASAYLGVTWVEAQSAAPIRILPGAETAILMLQQDPLLAGSTWDVYDLASILSRWVVTV